MRKRTWAALLLALCGAAPLAAQPTIPRLGRPGHITDTAAAAIVRVEPVATARSIRVGPDLVVQSICAIRDASGRNVGTRVLIANVGKADASREFWVASEYSYASGDRNFQADSTPPLPAGQSRWIEYRHLGSIWAGSPPLADGATAVQVFVDVHFSRRRSTSPPPPPGFERQDMPPVIAEMNERNNSLRVAGPLGQCVQRQPRVSAPRAVESIRPPRPE